MSFCVHILYCMCSVFVFCNLIHCVTVFLLLKLLLFSLLKTWFPDAPLFYFSLLLNISGPEKCWHETLNLRRMWTKSWTLECFYSWRKCFSHFLYPHCVSYLCLFDSTECKTFRAMASVHFHFISITPLCRAIHPLDICISSGLPLSSPGMRSFDLFHNPIMSAIGFLWSPLDPSGWASKPALN